jgi:hypothetical protein
MQTFYTPPFNCNQILFTGTNVSWKDSMPPYPYLNAPAGATLTAGYKKGLYRYFGDDIIHNVFLQATLDTQPAVAPETKDYTMSLEFPVNLSVYTSNTIVGEFWLRASYGGSMTNYKAYAQTSGTNSNVVVMRYVNGTYDQSLTDIATGTTITIQGTLTYKTVLYSSLFIPAQYLPNRLYQDSDGKVALNNAGALVRARWEVIETSNNPAMIIDQRSAGDVLQFRSNETTVVTVINSKGNVGIGTSQAPHPMTVWGGMMFNGTMYDAYGNPLWIPGSSVDWKPTPSLPVISVPTGGTWVQNNSLTKGTWRFIGNEVSYNVAITGTMTVAPTNPAANFTLSLPAPVKLSAYTDTPTNSNVILGELWANIAYGVNSNMFKSFAMVDATNSNQVALRVLSGTTDTTFSTMTAPSTLTIRGQIHYTTTSNIMAISVPSTAIPANFTKDQQGRVALNSVNPPRAQLDIVMSNASPALIVDQQTSADMVQLMKSGVVVGGVDGNGNVGIGTSMAPEALNVVGNTTITGDFTAKNMSMFRNRIINGDMRVDQRGGGGSVGAGAGSSSASMTTTYSLDRWAIATGPASGTLCAAQTTLSATDQAAVGGVFTNAAVVGVAPATGLDAYYPFDGNVNDASGNGYNLTVTGSVSYVPGRVGSNAVYLANEANVIATPTKASNRLSFTYINPNTISVSFWLCVLKIPLSGQYTQVFSYGSSLIDSFTLQINADQTMNITTSSQSTTSSSVVINTWYHIYGSWTPSNTISFYKNGILVGNSSITEPSISSGIFQLGESVRSSYNRPFAGFIDDFRIYNRVLSATEIAALAGIAPIQVAPATTVASGLTTRLTFDNTTADTQGSLGAPTATGTTVYSSLSKSGTRSLDLTANTAYSTVTVGQTYTLTSGSFTLPITISLWINASSPTSLTQIPVCIGNNSVANTNAFIPCVVESSKIYAYTTIGATGYQAIANSFTPIENTWYHVTTTCYASGFLCLYINGVAMTTLITGAGSLALNQSGTGTINVLRIGGQTGTSLTSAYKGYIDDVRIYNRALSPQEVAGLYYSYQPSPYVLYQQPIEGLNVADLGWGTTAAQPATVSAWIKNNTASAQQFSLSAGNAGAAAAISVITFESGIEDTLGFLTNPVGTNVAYSTSVYKVGTRSLDLTANTAGSTTFSGSYITYVSANSIPYSISLWINANVINATQIPLFIPGMNIIINTSGQIWLEVSIGGSSYNTTPSTSTSIAATTWVHICAIVSYGGTTQLYINGIWAAASSTIPSSGSFDFKMMCLGGRPSSYSGTAYMFKGYIDDVRIYNKALTAAEVYQLYTKNAGSITTISQYLLPRSYLYTTPSIPANTWQKISFTIPGDTTDAAWAKDTTCGLNLALCLGAGGVYVSSGTSGWASAEYATGSSIQVFGGSATNFLAGAGNSIYITGVQLERGTLMTPFEFRPSGVELQLCQRYYEKSSGTVRLTFNQWGGGSSAFGASVWFKSYKRIIPSFYAPSNWEFYNSANASAFTYLPLNDTYNRTYETGSLYLQYSTTLPSAAMFGSGYWIADAEL